MIIFYPGPSFIISPKWEENRRENFLHGWFDNLFFIGSDLKILFLWYTKIDSIQNAFFLSTFLSLIPYSIMKTYIPSFFSVLFTFSLSHFSILPIKQSLSKTLLCQKKIILTNPKWNIQLSHLHLKSSKCFVAWLQLYSYGMIQTSVESTLHICFTQFRC